jgi:hypothetical protein
MAVRLIKHLRANVVAYLALAVALGGGGGYAFAATRVKTIDGCVVKKTGELIVKSRCARGQEKLTWNQQGPAGAVGATGATGASPFVASGTVAQNGVGLGAGFTVQESGVGEFDITLTGPTCAGNAKDNLVVSIEGDPSGEGGQFQHVQGGPLNGTDEFIVSTGNVSGGSYTPANQAFDLIGTC